MRDDDPQVQDAVFRAAMNPVPHPPYYPKAELKAAIAELIEELKVIRNRLERNEDNAENFREIAIMIAKHDGKQG